MATKLQDSLPSTPQVSIDANTLKEILTEVKKPYIDVDAEARKQRNRLKMREQERQAREQLAQAQADCTHMRDDGTSRIGWHDYADRVRRGVCQWCNLLIDPSHADYMRLVRIPTRGAGIVYA